MAKIKKLIKPFVKQNKEISERVKLSDADIRYIEKQQFAKRLSMSPLKLSRLIESGLVCKSFIELKKKEALQKDIQLSIYGDKNGS